MDISEAQKENMVYINERGFPVNRNSLTGAQLLEMAGFAANEYNIYIVSEENKSKEIKPEERVEIQNGLRFNVILKPG
jgi:hypothetical protein